MTSRLRNYLGAGLFFAVFGKCPETLVIVERRKSKTKRRIDRIVKAHVKASKGKAVDVGAWVEL